MNLTWRSRYGALLIAVLALFCIAFHAMAVGEETPVPEVTTVPEETPATSADDQLAVTPEPTAAVTLEEPIPTPTPTPGVEVWTREDIDAIKYDLDSINLLSWAQVCIGLAVPVVWLIAYFITRWIR